MLPALLSLLALSASAADFDTLLATEGWEAVATAETDDTGEIAIALKVIGGNECLRGVATIDVPIDAMMEVVTDIPSAKDWSSEKLIAARVLKAGDHTAEYYQHLDVPGWTMASDRYWVLRGTWGPYDGGIQAFRWDRFDWRAAYPELATELDRDHSGAVEPDPNWGSWMFVPVEGKTEARYYLCSDAGGSLPDWLKKAAATKTLPGTIADAVREGRRRAK